jgi:hypothetical protein
MWMAIVIVATVAAAGILVGEPLGNAAQGQADPNAVTVTVTVTGKGKDAPPVVAKNEVVARQAGKVRPVLAWEPAQTSTRGLDLVILIDDELPFHVTSRWDDFESFVNTLPANSHVGVAYANKGDVIFAQQPTVNHATAAKAFRNPANVELRSDAIYQSLQKLAAEWPANQNRHEILLLSSGYDSGGATGGQRPVDSIPVQDAVKDLQAKGIVVYSFYANPSSDPSTVTVGMAQWGQGGLEQLSTTTGGKTYSFSDGTPQSFAPWLQEVQQLLGQQYSLTFQAQPLGKVGLVAFEVKMENSGVQVHAPARVLVPGGK